MEPELETTCDEASTIPLPIQSFLWRLTEPFLRRKIGKRYEASCTTFEHVVIENKMQGLPPSFSSAVKSITRQRWVNACLPHIMHCTALLLINRSNLGQEDELSEPSRKLLHALQWIFIESAQEDNSCDQENQKNSGYLIAFENVRLFVYLFAPILDSIKESDLVDSRLNSGEGLWKPMWRFEQPNLPPFSAPAPVTDAFESNIELLSSSSLWTNKLLLSTSDRVSKVKSEACGVTIFDAAVICCLRHRCWPEDGVFWGITYVLKKMQRNAKLKLSEASIDYVRRRCRSLTDQEQRNIKKRQKRIFFLSPQGEMGKDSTETINQEQTSCNKHRVSASVVQLLSKRTSLRSSVMRLSPIRKRKMRITKFARYSIRRLSMSSATNKRTTIDQQKMSDLPPSYTVLYRNQIPSINLDKEKGGSLSSRKASREFASSSRDLDGHRPIRHFTDRPSSLSMHAKSNDSLGSPEGSTTTKSIHVETKFLKERKWTSDTSLNDCYPTSQSAATCLFADDSGSLRTDLILSVTDLVVGRNLSLRISDLCLQILDFLNGQNAFPAEKEEDLSSKKEEPTNGDNQITLVSAQLRILFGLVKQLGCDCGRSRAAYDVTECNDLREKIREMIENVVIRHKTAFRQYVREVVQAEPLLELMDLFHPLLLCCSVDVNTCEVKDVNDDLLCRDSETNNCLRSVLVKSAFRRIVDKCVQVGNSLYQNENKTLYTDLRRFVQYVRLNHPSTFNAVLLTIMSTPLRKKKRWMREQAIWAKEQEAKRLEEAKKREEEEKAKLLQKQMLSVNARTPVSRHSIRRGALCDATDLWSLSNAGKTKQSRSPNKKSCADLLEKNSPGDQSLNLSRRPTLDNASDEDDILDSKFVESDKNFFSKVQMASIFKAKQSPKSLFSDDGEDGFHDDASEKSQLKPKKKKLKQANKETGGTLEEPKPNPSTDERETTKAIERDSEFSVEGSDIYNGSRIIQFLMDCCPPGTVPEPNVVGAVLGLDCTHKTTMQSIGRNLFEREQALLAFNAQESPVVSRAAVFLQLANFVEGCSNGIWPRWMIQRLMRSKRCNKNAVYYSTAARLFHRWGEALSQYLDVAIEHNSHPAVILAEVTKKEDKMQHRRDDYRENFLNDLRVNETGKSCPTALALVASDLLYQITVFLRDVYPRLPHRESADRQQDLHESQHKTISARRPSGLSFPSDLTADDSAATSTRHMHGAGASGTNNMLNVPTSNIYLGGNSPFSSCSHLSFGSCVSLGASSTTSEIPGTFREVVDVVSSPSTYFSSNRTESTVSGCPQSVPWLKVMSTLTHQQNFLCNHVEFCHPFCHRRMNRSCNRLITAIHGAFANHKKAEIALNAANANGTRATLDFPSYLKRRATNLTRSPLSVMLKAITSMSDEMLVEIQAVCWELLIEGNKSIVEAAGSVFLLCAVKVPEVVRSTILDEVTHSSSSSRVRALRKLMVLWECRNNVWKNAELKAKSVFKVPSSGVSFTLSMADIGIDVPITPEPPWIPNIININEVLAESSSTQSAAFLTTDTLSHYKEQQLKKLLKKESEKRKIVRENFHLTDVPFTHTICKEVKKIAVSEEIDDETPNKRRPSSRLMSVGSSSVSFSWAEVRKEDWKRHSRWRINQADDSSQENIHRLDHVVSLPANPVFPPSVAVCLLGAFDCINDSTLNESQECVGDVTRWLISDSLNQDASLCMKSVIERFSEKTEKGKRHHALSILRKLPLILPEITPGIAHTLFNHLIETIIHCSRISSSANDSVIISCLLAITSLVPHVQPIDLKTLKMALRKVQIDGQLLPIVGTTGVKKLTVWNQGDFYMPTQVEVNDKSTFDSVLREALFSTDEPESDAVNYQLFDRHKDQILCKNSYVRDFYQYKKSVYPELNLVKMNPEEGNRLMAQRIVSLKLADIARLRFSIAALRHQKNSLVHEFNATFVQDELKKLWSFPRKAMDADFFMFKTTHGDLVKNFDILLKYYWIEFTGTVLLSLSKDFPWEDDLVIFVHVLTAALVVHCDDASSLRRIAATLIDIIVHFGHTFVLQGYNLILPSLLCIYSKHYNDDLIRSSLELVFKQMLRVHGQPFLLQLFANSASLLSEYKWLKLTGDSNPEDQLSHEDFFRLLQTLQQPTAVDPLQIMKLVKAEKPLQAVDQTLRVDYGTLTVIHHFRLCITVIAYQPETNRALEMLIVMNSILPWYLDHIRKSASSHAKEYTQLNEVAACIRTLLSCVEVLTRTVNSGSQQQQQQQQQQQSEQPQKRSIRSVEEGVAAEESAEKLQTTEDFIAPRDVILQLCTTFYTHARLRVIELNCELKQNDEFLSCKSHTRLTDIAQSLLKLFTDESVPTVSLGLACYVKQMMPLVPWRVPALLQTLPNLLKRLDRYLGKISKVYSFKRGMDRRTLSMMLTGLCDLLSRQPAMSFLPHFKSFVNIGTAMQLGTTTSASSRTSNQSCKCKTQLNLSPTITPSIIKLIALQTQASGDGFSLQDALKPFLGPRTTVNFFLNLVIPICLCVAAETALLPHAEDRSEKMKWSLHLPKSDVVFLLNVCLDSLLGRHHSVATPLNQLLLATSPVAQRNIINTNDVALVALRIVIACFEQQLAGEWFTLAQKIKDIAMKNSCGTAIWKFMIFTIRYKTPLFLHLKPFVVRQFMKRPLELVEETDLKDTLNDILEKRHHQQVLLSSLTDDFIKDIIELLQPKSSSSAGRNRLKTSKAQNTTSSNDLNDSSTTGVKVRSRIHSFRHAVSSLQAKAHGNDRSGDDVSNAAAKQRGRYRRSFRSASQQQRSPPLSSLLAPFGRRNSRASNRDDSQHSPWQLLGRRQTSFSIRTDNHTLKPPRSLDGANDSCATAPSSPRCQADINEEARYPSSSSVCFVEPPVPQQMKTSESYLSIRNKKKVRRRRTTTDLRFKATDVEREYLAIPLERILSSSSDASDDSDTPMTTPMITTRFGHSK